MQRCRGAKTQRRLKVDENEISKIIVDADIGEKLVKNGIHRVANSL